jgi:hypothetical protein
MRELMRELSVVRSQIFRKGVRGQRPRAKLIDGGEYLH